MFDMEMPSWGSPKAGCWPAFVVMLLIVLLMGAGFIWVLWWATHGMK